jgi:hypothetical protein
VTLVHLWCPWCLNLSNLAHRPRRSHQDHQGKHQGHQVSESAHNGGDSPKTFHGYDDSIPPFPEHFSLNAESSRSGTVGGKTWAIMPPMTRHNATQTGLGTPSPLDRWINALLRGFAMLVSHAARLCSMRLIRLSVECHNDATPEALPCGESGKLKETKRAAGSSHIRRESASTSNAKEGLILRTRSAQAELVDSKGAGLTGAAPRGIPPLGKGRSDLSKTNRGGDHFVPRPQFSLQRRHPSHPCEVTPTPTSLRTSRTSPFQGEVRTAPA